MAHTVGFGKTTFEVLSRDRLPPDVRIALAEFRNQLKLNPSQLVDFWNGDVEPGRNKAVGEAVLPSIRRTHGRRYVESRVGQATAPTSMDPNKAGVRRLVAEIDTAGNVHRIYFTDAHSRAGSWFVIQYS